MDEEAALAVERRAFVLVLRALRGVEGVPRPDDVEATMLSCRQLADAEELMRVVKDQECERSGRAGVEASPTQHSARNHVALPSRPTTSPPASLATRDELIKESKLEEKAISEKTRLEKRGRGAEMKAARAVRCGGEEARKDYRVERIEDREN